MGVRSFEIKGAAVGFAVAAAAVAAAAVAVGAVVVVVAAAAAADAADQATERKGIIRRAVGLALFGSDGFA